MSFFESKESAIGLEIEAFSLRAVELKKSIPYKLVHYAAEELESGIVKDGEIIEAEDVVQALKRLWQKGKFAGKKVILGIANPKVFIRQVELPYMEDSALRNAINFQAQEYVPFPPEELILDYHVLNEFEGEDKQRMLEVLLVAAHKEMVNTFCQAVEKAGLYVETVYLSSLALVHSMFEPVADSNNMLVTGNEENMDMSTVIVKIGADVTSIVVVEKGFARFARTMTIGGNDFTQIISNRLGISFKEAEEIKKNFLPTCSAACLSLTSFEGGKPESEQSTKPVRKDGLGVIEKPEEVAEMLRDEANKFIAELRRSLEYYFGEEIDKESIERIILTGGGAELVGFDEYIGEKLKIDTKKGSTLNRIDVSHVNKELVEEIENQEPSLGVVVGLAIRGVE